MSRSGDSQMLQFTLATAQAAGNFPKGMSPAHWQKKHGHKLPPEGKSPGMAFGFGFLHRLLEFDSGKQL